jgi:hypothetical protein
MSRWLGAGLVAVLAAAALFFVLRPDAKVVPTGDPETRIVAYLKENIRPGRAVFVTDLHNNVFTSREEREALQRLYDAFFSIPASAAQIYTKTGRIPTLQELSDQFDLKVPGEMDVLLRIMEYDPRVPRFFERDPATGEITSIDVDRIASEERFGRPLRDR